jgi:hypothetical protein
MGGAWRVNLKPLSMEAMAADSETFTWQKYVSPSMAANTCTAPHAPLQWGRFASPNTFWRLPYRHQQLTF